MTNELKVIIASTRVDAQRIAAGYGNDYTVVFDEGVEDTTVNLTRAAPEVQAPITRWDHWVIVLSK